MKCVNCNIEMESGYMLQLGISGNINIVKASAFKSEKSPTVFVCAKCGKVELYVDDKSTK